MATRAFPSVAGRLNRQATPVASVDDIRRAITLCLAERRPCVLTMTDNIPLSSTLTLPGGLRAFSIDGGGRWAFILTTSMLFAIRSRGAEEGNGFPVEFSNLSFRTKEGVTVSNLLGVDQYDTGQSRQRTTLTGVGVDTTAAGSSIPIVVKMAGEGFVASVDLLDVSIIGSATTVWGGDVDPKTWEYCEVKRLNINTTSTSSWTSGLGFEPSFIGAVSLVTGTIDVVVTADFGAWSFQDSNVSTYSNASASTEVTLLRVVASSRTVGPVDVDLDNISVPAAPSLGLGDWWYEARFGSNNAAAMDFFVGAAVASGTNSTAIPAAAVDGVIPAGVFLRSNTTANGGYRYQTSSLVGDRFGVTSHKYWAQFRWRTSFTGCTVLLGFHDSATVADPVDGAYFKVTADVVSAVTANNSTRTTNATTVTLSLDVIYTFDVEVNAAGTSARFRVYAGTSSTPILDVTNTTNIPTTSARAFGTGIVATEASTTASDIGILYMQGAGTVAGFERARGQP